jgi:hypothetical protein
VGWGNGLILGCLTVRSGLVPPRLASHHRHRDARALPRDRSGRVGAGLATAPEFIWELGLGIYPIVWGFRASSPILAPNPNAYA